MGFSVNKLKKHLLDKNDLIPTTSTNALRKNISSNELKRLNPFWVTGFCDAEGSFSMSISRSKTAKFGWVILPAFSITVHIVDIELINQLQNFFAVGSISITGKQVQYRVRSRSDLWVIIDHFNMYPLQTTKKLSFAYFCKIFDMLCNKQHSTVKGFLIVISLINKLNKPISYSLLTEIIKLGPLPDVDDCIVTQVNPMYLNPYWISGFACGEGSFTFFTRKRLNALGEIVSDYTFIFEISQKSIDIHTLELISSYFNNGKIYTSSGISRFRINNIDIILDKIVLHFDKYPLEGHKYLQYKSWLEAVKCSRTFENNSYDKQNKLKLLTGKLSILSQRKHNSM